MKLNDLEQKLLKALIAARDHLDYCGYGDAWEREGAKAQKLPEQIEGAILSAMEKVS